MSLSLKDLPQKCCLAGVMYQRSGHYTIQHTVGSPLAHFFWCCTIAFPTVTVNWLNVKDTWDAVKDKESEEDGQIGFLRTLLVRLVSSEDSTILVSKF